MARPNFCEYNGWRGLHRVLWLARLADVAILVVFPIVIALAENSDVRQACSEMVEVSQHFEDILWEHSCLML